MATIASPRSGLAGRFTYGVFVCPVREDMAFHHSFNIRECCTYGIFVCTVRDEIIFHHPLEVNSGPRLQR